MSNIAAELECQLAESQALVVKLCEALENHSGNYKLTKAECAEINAVIQQDESQNDTALRELLTKAGDVMRERACDKVESEHTWITREAVSRMIRAIPGVTLEDLK